MPRKYVDCREHPNAKNCSLRISGTEDEVIQAATTHATTAHNEPNSPEFQEWLKKNMKDESEQKQTTEKGQAA
jgi:hypothetical protein